MTTRFGRKHRLAASLKAFGLARQPVKRFAGVCGQLAELTAPRRFRAATDGRKTKRVSFVPSKKL